MAMGMFVVPTWKRLMNDSIAGDEVADGDADRHRQEDPERQVAVEERQPPARPSASAQHPRR